MDKLRKLIATSALCAVAAAGSLLLASPANAATDAGYYTTCAGPVYLSAAGHCVDWYGYISGTNEHRNNTNCG
ncbi:hypothetical protein ACFWTE_00515 [Nocardiopsis sp. NPDC058631]|uniref:hypothetical protein n=1 Tax=Nocardiopsis sp. NPDC058631 TaxID=3346566 RepID=UPI003654A739